MFVPAKENKQIISLQSHNHRSNHFSSNFLIYFFLILLAILCMIPFYLMLIYSTHSNDEIAARFIYLPGHSLLDNFDRMIKNVNIGRGFMNSIIISFSSTFLNLYFGALTGYGFSKFNFKGNKKIFTFLLATMMVPGQLSLIGSYRWMNTLHLLDSYAAIILPAAASAFTVFFLKQFIDSGIPNEILESARMDGAGEFMIYNRIILPMLFPALSALGIFSFIGSWNNFMGPLVLLFSEDKFPLPVIVALVQSYYGTDYGLLYLGVALSVIPIIIVFSIFSKRIMGGVAIGSVKG
ncbi:carbohydrate ABC transporter permease [Paenibacillus sp. GCM10027628]|uniref:carbohydrate ABC transporter permease n=1 Tax=Paenibacillus sp. GCM10027628 TaxID=3273413 RepID=UPI0036372D4B